MDLLTADQVATLARVPVKTLRHWATHWDRDRTGPQPHRLAPRVTRYRQDEVAAWLGVEPSQLRIPA